MEPVSDRVIEYLQTEKKYILQIHIKWWDDLEIKGFHTFEELQDYVLDLLQSKEMRENENSRQLLGELRDSRTMSVQLYQRYNPTQAPRGSYDDDTGKTYEFRWVKTSDL